MIVITNILQQLTQNSRLVVKLLCLNEVNRLLILLFREVETRNVTQTLRQLREVAHFTVQTLYTCQVALQG